MKRKVKLAATMLLAAGVAWAQTDGIDYQDRGDRYEGRRRLQVGGTDIELIGAMIVSSAPSLTLPESLSLSFFLQEPAEAHVVVRELQPQKNYWLDRVRPMKPWLARSVNRFSWSTAPVLRELGLEPRQLVALVRLGYSEPRVSEVVAPSELGSGNPSAFTRDYQFVFRTSRPAEIDIQLSGCKGRPEATRVKSKRRVPFEVLVRTEGTSAEKCHLALDGVMPDDETHISQNVDFFTMAREMGK